MDKFYYYESTEATEMVYSERNTHVLNAWPFESGIDSVLSGYI